MENINRQIRFMEEHIAADPTYAVDAYASARAKSRKAYREGQKATGNIWAAYAKKWRAFIATQC